MSTPTHTVVAGSACMITIEKNASLKNIIDVMEYEATQGASQIIFIGLEKSPSITKSVQLEQIKSAAVEMDVDVFAILNPSSQTGALVHESGFHLYSTLAECLSAIEQIEHGGELPEGEEAERSSSSTSARRSREPVSYRADYLDENTDPIPAVSPQSLGSSNQKKKLITAPSFHLNWAPWMTKALIVVICIALLAGAGYASASSGLLAFLGVGKVTVTIIPTNKTISADAQITAGPGIPFDTTQKTLPIRDLSQVTASGTLTVPATGRIDTNAQAAQGQVTLSNYNDSAVTLQAGTTISANDGTQFKTQAKVIVAGSKLQGNGVPAPGQATITITATQPGAKGNIAAGAINTQISALTVHNKAAFTGGQDEVHEQVIAQSDIDSGKQQLLQQLQPQLNSKLSSQLSSGEKAITPFTYTISDTTDNPVNTAAAQVTITAAIAATGYAYQVQQYDAILDTLLKQAATNSSASFSLLSGSTNYSSPTASSSANQSFAIHGTATAVIVYQLTSQQIQQITQAIAGKSVSYANTYLNHQSAYVSSAQIKVPGNWSSLPTSASSIQIIIKNPPVS